MRMRFFGMLDMLHTYNVAEVLVMVRSFTLLADITYLILISEPIAKTKVIFDDHQAHLNRELGFFRDK